VVMQINISMAEGVGRTTSAVRGSIVRGDPFTSGRIMIHGNIRISSYVASPYHKYTAIWQQKCTYPVTGSSNVTMDKRDSRNWEEDHLLAYIIVAQHTQQHA